ncbi:prepilin-type N-terminal cleavage/methylation domain-containing protein [Candidatus Daviesbacteria bacterium]|nr:prepilin-type N-terminal cleavage/methylation domain-containing protein [Candidatus Daviesbacteria bacterium]
MLSAQRGFTLIELLVVIAIMGLVGAFTLANYRSFGEDQNLKNALLDVQSILRTAQTNATANVKCDTQYGATWTVEFSSTTNINLKCTEPQASATLKKSSSLGSNIEIQSITGTGSNCPSGLPFQIAFASLKRQADLGNANCASVTIIIKNNKGAVKSLVIEQGGRIYEQ